MQSRVISYLMVLLAIGSMRAEAELRYTVLIRLPLADESVIISLEQPVYFPGDTIRVTIIRDDPEARVVVTPILSIEGIALEEIGNAVYAAMVPLDVTPGSYPVRLNVLDSQRRQLIYDTDCIVEVEEFQDVEEIGRFVRIVPDTGGSDAKTAIMLDREQIRNLAVVFQRDSIREGMGPQFVTIRTTVQSRRGRTERTFERRIMTFRSHGDSNKDRAMFIQYRTAYGPYAAVRSEDLEQVQLEVDSLPSWGLVKVSVEPDYTIKIGAFDRSNAMIRYFRVKGPRIEAGLTVGAPKVLYDTRASDSIEYGNTSAMVRLYYIDGASGHRFPFNLGIGVFGVNSPIDVSAGRGGFATSLSLDLIELMRRLDMDVGTRVNAGLELTPFFPVERKWRILFDAHVGFAL